MQRELARTNNRSQARWRFAAVIALACLAASGAAERAGAAVTVGQVAPGPPSADCTTDDRDYLQPSVTGGNLYVARQAGTITSWTTNSAGFGGRYVVKIFRRTSDPEVFRVMGHSSSVLLGTGLITVPTRLPVRSGDMLGLHETDAPNACTFDEPGDNVITRSGSLADGSSGTFNPVNDVRLNLSATLIPDNSFTLSPISRDRKRGTATVTVTTSNPGLVALGGKGLRKRASRSLAVAGPVTFKLAAAGKTARLLARKGRATVRITLTFTPTGGEPSSQPIQTKLRTVTAPPAPL